MPSRESNEELGLALDAAQVGTVDWDLPRGRVQCSRWSEALWGFQPGEFDGDAHMLLGRVHAEDVSGFSAALTRSDALGGGSFEHHFRVVRVPGDIRRLTMRGSFTFDPGGCAVRLRGVVLQAKGAHITDAAVITLRQERAFSDAVLNSLPGVLYLYDRTGKFLRWNRNFEQVTGYTSAEIATMNPMGFFREADQERVAARISEVFKQGAAEVDADLLSKDGRTRPYHFTGVRVEIDGQSCLVGVGIDVAERRRAEEERSTSEGRYRTLFEQAPDGIVIADSNSTYLDANASICRMLGYARDEFVGLNASDIVDGEEVPHIGHALDVIKARGDYHREWRFKRKDGSTFPAEVIATVMPDGNLLGMIRDITERKDAEKALRVLNDGLEATVAARTAELRAALVRAEAADRIKSAFLATMSHELRTPLNSIIGFTGIVLQGLAGPLTAEQSKQLGMVRVSARHLLDLINDVLDISKIEAEQLEVRLEPFDLRASLQRAIASMSPAAEKKGLTLASVLPPSPGEWVVVSDQRRVEQIVLNLLNNAVKFTETGGITLVAEIADRAEPPATPSPRPAVRLMVKDTGMGIKAQDLATLFQPFRQIDTGLTRQYGGTGLGLAICRRLARLLGGDISVSSEWSKGSTFTVTLPAEGLHPS